MADDLYIALLRVFEGNEDKVLSTIDILVQNEITSSKSLRSMNEKDLNDIIDIAIIPARRGLVKDALFPFIKGRENISSDNCFPPLGNRFLGLSKPSIPPDSEHAPAIIVEQDFSYELHNITLPTILLKLDSSLIWSFKRADNLSWSHEADINNFVGCLVKDVIAMYGLGIILSLEVSLKYVQPDLWILKSTGTGIPLGAIMVKIPLDDGDDSATLTNLNVAGQAFDYLLELRNTVGLYGPVFVIVTTYTTWRIYWIRGQKERAKKILGQSELLMRFNELTTQDASDSALDSLPDSDSLSESPLPSPANHHTFVESLWHLCRTNTLPQSEEETTKAPVPPTPIKRIIFADSRIFKITQGAQLREALVQTLVLMLQCGEFRQPAAGLHETLRVAATQYSWDWIDPLPKNFKLYPDKFPNKNTHQLIFLADLGIGIHGRVWLTCSTGGAMCVLKFFTTPGAETKELKFWQKVYPLSKARVQSFMGQPALLMPPLPPCPLQIRSDPEVKEAVVQSVSALLNKGVYHGDLRWANFGFVKNRCGCLLALPFDFGNAIMFESNEKNKYEAESNKDIEKMFSSV